MEVAAKVPWWNVKSTIPSNTRRRGGGGKQGEGHKDWTVVVPRVDIPGEEHSLHIRMGAMPTKCNVENLTLC